MSIFLCICALFANAELSALSTEMLPEAKLQPPQLAHEFPGMPEPRGDAPGMLRTPELEHSPSTASALSSSGSRLAVTHIPLMGRAVPVQGMVAIGGPDLAGALEGRLSGSRLVEHLGQYKVALYTMSPTGQVKGPVATASLAPLSPLANIVPHSLPFTLAGWAQHGAEAVPAFLVALFGPAAVPPALNRGGRVVDTSEALQSVKGSALVSIMVMRKMDTAPVQQAPDAAQWRAQGLESAAQQLEPGEATLSALLHAEQEGLHHAEDRATPSGGNAVGQAHMPSVGEVHTQEVQGRRLDQTGKLHDTVRIDAKSGWKAYPAGLVPPSQAQAVAFAQAYHQKDAAWGYAGKQHHGMPHAFSSQYPAMGRGYVPAGMDLAVTPGSGTQAYLLAVARYSLHALPYMMILFLLGSAIYLYSYQLAGYVAAGAKSIVQRSPGRGATAIRRAHRPVAAPGQNAVAGVQLPSFMALPGWLKYTWRAVVGPVQQQGSAGPLSAGRTGSSNGGVTRPRAQAGSRSSLASAGIGSSPGRGGRGGFPASGDGHRRNSSRLSQSELA